MAPRNRREFLADVGRGMLAAGLGPALIADLGLGSVEGAEPAPLQFGAIEPLVCFMQETPINKLLPALAEKQKAGTSLRELVGAAALANARTFGGEDYIGFHTIMAMAPAYSMAQELSGSRQALPVFKVLYRNTNRIQQKGGRSKEVLQPVKAGPLPEGKNPGDLLMDQVQRKDLAAAEGTLAALAGQSPELAYNTLLHVVEDGQEVHRINLAYRAWDLLSIVGKEHAETMLRQSVHYCVQRVSPRYNSYFSDARTLVPKLLDQHKLLAKPFGAKRGDDAWVDQLAKTLFKSAPAQAAEAVAVALAEGFHPDDVGEALGLAANQIVLREKGRAKNRVEGNKPLGSVHGDGTGVHACDSANAWRNIARVSNQRNTAVCLILGAHQMAKDRDDGGNMAAWEPYPLADVRDRVKTDKADVLLRMAEEAIRGNDQQLATAAVQRYGELGLAARPVFDLLLQYAISEDGALHAEKYYRTASDEFASTRAAFRWRQVVALARVTASEFGWPAPGYAEACDLLKA
ncbi:MAG: hypothetical protein AB7K24_09840 [Gemmataceae bacterium]